MEISENIGLKGLYSDLPQDMAPDGALIAGSKNFRIISGTIFAKPGYELIQASTLIGTPQLVHEHEDIQGTKSLLVMTTSDIYVWDDSNAEFDFLTPRYNTGTATCAGSTKDVEGSGTNWDPEIDDGDWIKFDTNDIDGTGTPDTWYEIDSVTDDTNLVLVLNGPDTGGAVNYVVRKIYGGSTVNRWEAANYYDSSADENLLIATNGADVVQKWDPDNTYMEDLGGTPPQARHVAVVAGLLVLGNITVVSGTGTDLPYTVIYSPPADAEAWDGGATDDANYQELYRTTGAVNFMAPFADYLLIGKEDCLIMAKGTGDVTAPLDFDYVVMSGGSISPAYCMTPRGILYLGASDIFVYTGTGQPTSIAYGKIKETLFDNFNFSKKHVVTSEFSPRYNEWRLSVPSRDADLPDITYIYRIVENEWCYDDVGFNALGSYNYKTITTINSLSANINTYTNAINEWSATGAFNEIIMVDSSGYVYIERPTLKQNNGVNVSCVAKLAGFPGGNIDDYSRFIRTYIHYTGTNDASDIVSVQISVDGGITFATVQQINNAMAEVRQRARLSWNHAGRTCIVQMSGRHMEVHGVQYVFQTQNDR